MLLRYWFINTTSSGLWYAHVWLQTCGVHYNFELWEHSFDCSLGFFLGRGLFPGVRNRASDEWTRKMLDKNSDFLLPFMCKCAAICTSYFAYMYDMSLYLREDQFDLRHNMWQIMSHRYWSITIPLNPNFQVTTRPSMTQSHKLCWSFRLQNRKWISVWISKLQTEYQVCEMPQNDRRRVKTVPLKNVSIRMLL